MTCFFLYEIFEIWVSHTYNTSHLGPVTFQVLNSPRGWGLPYWAARVTESETRRCADGNHSGGFHLSRPALPPSSPGCCRCVGALKVSVTLRGACWQPAGPCLLWSCHSWLWWPSYVRTLCLERRPKSWGCFSEIDTSVYLPGCQNTGSAYCQPPPGGLWGPGAWAVGWGPPKPSLSQTTAVWALLESVSDLSKWVNCVSISTSVCMPGLVYFTDRWLFPLHGLLMHQSNIDEPWQCDYSCVGGRRVKEERACACKTEGLVFKSCLGHVDLGSNPASAM